MTYNTYLETWDDDSMTSFQFSPQGGSATATYEFDLPGATPDNMQSVIIDILGATNTSLGSLNNVISGQSGSILNRILPATHPLYPYFYAEKISSMLGKGSGNAAIINNIISPVSGNPAPIAKKFALYSKYQIKVDFTTRLYNVLPDNQLTIASGSWYNGNSNTPVSFLYCPEYLRYTDWTLSPQSNTIKGGPGAFQFNTSTSPNPPGLGQWPASPFMYLPDSILKFNWRQVPYRYITSSNSYIAQRGWLGRVNQNNWYLWPKGSLLFLSFAVTPYNQPNFQTQSSTDVPSGVTYTTYSKLCDIEFTFLYTSRTNSSTPSANIANNNWIPYGHNLLPYVIANRGFYFAQTAPISSGGTLGPPMFLSCPFEALFQDPDIGLNI